MVYGPWSCPSQSSLLLSHFSLSLSDDDGKTTAAAASCSLGEQLPLSSLQVEEEADTGSKSSSSSPHATGKIGTTTTGDANAPVVGSFLTDRANFSENVDMDTKIYVIKMGPCKPKDPFTITDNRSFFLSFSQLLYLCHKS